MSIPDSIFNLVRKSIKKVCYDELRELTGNKEQPDPGITQVKPNSLTANIHYSTDNSFPCGLYRGYKFESYHGPIFSESGRYPSYFTFYPDGRVLYGHPETDRANIWGRYQSQGNVVYIAWNDGGQVSSPIADDGSVEFFGCRYSFFQQLF
jgi:hypothetical protein